MDKRELYQAMIDKFDKDGADLIIELVKVMLDKPKKKRKNNEYPPEFEALWAYLPRGGKDEAYKAYCKKVDHDLYPDEVIIASIQAHKKIEWAGRPNNMIPHLSKFINQGYYKTEIKAKQTVSKPRCGCGRILNSGEKQSGICINCEYKQKLEREKK